MGMKPRKKPKYDHGVTELVFHHDAPPGKECMCSFREMMNSSDFCANCGRLCCGCFLTAENVELCFDCYDEEYVEITEDLKYDIEKKIKQLEERTGEKWKVTKAQE